MSGKKSKKKRLQVKKPNREQQVEEARKLLTIDSLRLLDALGTCLTTLAVQIVEGKHEVTRNKLIADFHDLKDLLRQTTMSIMSIRGSIGMSMEGPNFTKPLEALELAFNIPPRPQPPEPEKATDEEPAVGGEEGEPEEAGG